MKHFKTAVAVTGSVMALGGATPAMAADAPAQNPTSPSLSLNQGLYQALQPGNTLDLAPIDGPIADSLANTLKTRELLGGLPLG
ncbi:hypothetical protein [Streptomyces sp. NPDC048172]|uniref:hypothetical protein n=1 Tax=Streptomyces sp. NPDC048172 TaxID=3365505 RepID=UPI003711DCC0